MPLEPLLHGPGYSIDLRSPRVDRIAVQAAKIWFGEELVDVILTEKHRASVSIDAIKTDIFEYNRIYVPKLVDDTYDAVLASVRSDFVPVRKLIPWTLGNALTRVPLGKSPGLPWKSRGYRTKHMVLEDPRALSYIHKEWDLIARGQAINLPDSLVYFRSQISTRDVNKVRATWGYPMSVVVEEGRFVYPYLDWAKSGNKDVPVAYGIEMATGGMAYIDEMWTNASPGSTAIMLDWSRFDKSVPAWLIRDAFAILRHAYDFTKVCDSEGKIWNVNSKQSERRWSKLIRYFINTPFSLPSGDRYRKDNGVPSGSGFTNLIDTIVNAIVTRYTCFHTTGHLPEHDLYMGDDSVLTSPYIVNMDDMAAFAMSQFGMKINVDKSYSTTNRMNLFFLGFWNVFGYPVRDQDYLLASFMMPERFKVGDDPSFTAIRALGQMWSTLNGHAAAKWYEIVRWIEREYLLPPDWVEATKVRFPSIVKWLELSGIQKHQVVVPPRPSWLLHQVEPPFRSARGSPSKRVTDIQTLYAQHLLYTS